jgi:hypothetical protein
MEPSYIIHYLSIVAGRGEPMPPVTLSKGEKVISQPVYELPAHILQEQYKMPEDRVAAVMANWAHWRACGEAIARVYHNAVHDTGSDFRNRLADLYLQNDCGADHNPFVLLVVAMRALTDDLLAMGHSAFRAGNMNDSWTSSILTKALCETLVYIVRVLAGGRLAGSSVAGSSVAGSSVAGSSVAGSSVAGSSVAAIGQLAGSSAAIDADDEVCLAALSAYILSDTRAPIAGAESCSALATKIVDSLKLAMSQGKVVKDEIHRQTTNAVRAPLAVSSRGGRPPKLSPKLVELAQRSNHARLRRARLASVAPKSSMPRVYVFADVSPHVVLKVRAGDVVVVAPDALADRGELERCARAKAAVREELAEHVGKDVDDLPASQLCVFRIFDDLRKLQPSHTLIEDLCPGEECPLFHLSDGASCNLYLIASIVSPLQSITPQHTIQHNLCQAILLLVRFQAALAGIHDTALATAHVGVSLTTPPSTSRGISPPKPFAFRVIGRVVYDAADADSAAICALTPPSEFWAIGVL